MTVRQDRPHLAPPKLGMRLLVRLLPEEERSEALGDFEERLQTKVRKRGVAAARIWYAIQILRLVPYLVKDHALWSSIMFKNHLIVAWRNVKKSKAYSALNILGLAVGMAVFILIMLFVRTELSFDRYHANAENILPGHQGGARELLFGLERLRRHPGPPGPGHGQGISGSPGGDTD